MKVWYCREHRSLIPAEGYTRCYVGLTDRELTLCDFTEMQLVPADARETQCLNCKFVYELERMP